MIRTTLLAVFLAIMPLSAHAVDKGTHSQYPSGTLLSSVPCSASDASRTFTIANTLGYGVGLFVFSLTWGAATSVDMSCSVATSATTPYGILQDCDKTTPGICESVDASWTKPVTASKVWTWRVDFLAAPRLRCIVSCTGSPTSDAITVTSYLSAY